ncbi:glycosyl transferase [Halobacteroides halobius DSM 5150]|uniref:Glucosyl-3-phosphoglycerate synthase n=1 Tax=Halobacteroides halobius (strain ATCC 35273 / DSM 5150 / MD-1) TaxID=748449 RepID=L0K6L7_HALHC|nr:glycosyltransferase family 2 protein [Halobacteroides halobius]AGB40671.1 glycosyl transferase [Halobacteroides halobius DSM 5150]
MSVTAVIPAYNEEETIGEVVSKVKAHKLVNNVIVISDGSEDNTAAIARDTGAEVIELESNLGKGAAIQTGIDIAKGDIILFLDADLLRLTLEHIDQLLLPVINQEAEMTVGVFTAGRFTTDLAQKITPFLSGQRAVKSKLLDDIASLEMTQFGVEIALTQYAKENNIKIKEVELQDLTHVMKEEKLGVFKGLRARLKMYWEIIKNLPRNKIK